jgi:hypothetical protein
MDAIFIAWLGLMSGIKFHQPIKPCHTQGFGIMQVMPKLACWSTYSIWLHYKAFIKFLIDSFPCNIVNQILLTI